MAESSRTHAERNAFAAVNMLGTTMRSLVIGEARLSKEQGDLKRMNRYLDRAFEILDQIIEGMDEIENLLKRAHHDNS